MGDRGGEKGRAQVAPPREGYKVGRRMVEVKGTRCTFEKVGKLR